MLWPRVEGPVASWPARLASTFEGPGRLPTQTLMFMSAGIEGSAAMAERLEDARAEAAADHRRLFRAGLAAHGR